MIPLKKLPFILFALVTVTSYAEAISTDSSLSGNKAELPEDFTRFGKLERVALVKRQKSAIAHGGSGLKHHEKNKRSKDDEDSEDFEEEGYPKFDEGGDSQPAETDPEYATPKNDSWLSDIDFSVIEGKVRPVGSGVCESAKCDGTDNDECFETCGNMATPEDVYGCPGERTWSLTFDDGPSEFTHELLDILDTLKVKATFCVMGAHAKKFPDIIKRAYDSGHQIASHTYSHPHMMSLSNEDIVHEVRATEEVIQKAIGVKPKYLRPPYGEADHRVKALLKQMGYKVLMWNVDPTDYNVHMLEDGPDRIQRSFQKVIDEKKSSLNIHSDRGFISLQHDLYQVSIQQVPKIVRALQAGNYSMVTSATCLGDDEPHLRLATNLTLKEFPHASRASDSKIQGTTLTSLSKQDVSSAKESPKLSANPSSSSAVKQITAISLKALETDLSDKSALVGPKKQKSDAMAIRTTGYMAVFIVLIPLLHNFI